MPADRGNRLTSPGLTDQQRRALTAGDVSVALSAGAGCGKTFVLTERFLAELEPGGEGRPRLSQLVAITFTERAAREMRGRIRSACQRRLLECPEEHVGHWQELIRELDSARISTIHAFCGALLRAHAVEAGLDPRFRVLDGAQAGTLLFELIDDELRNRLADRDEVTLTLLVQFGLDRLRGMISRLLAVRQEIEWPQWRGETPDGLVARWQAFWLSDTLPRALRRIGESAAARTVLDLATRYPPAHAKMRERCDFLREQLPRLTCGAGVPPASGAMPTPAVGMLETRENCDVPTASVGMAPFPSMAPQDFAGQLKAIREAAKVQGGGTKKDWVSEDVYNRFRDAAADLREEIDAVVKRMDFDPAKARPAAEAALQLLSVAAVADAKYAEKKRELGVLDFNDLLIHARDLLAGPERRGLRRQLAGHIRLLLVDEFQDTDPLQVGLVKALCDNEHLRGKLFFVGDYKQSIYRFRGADPHVFRQLREEIPPGGRLPLSLNFRSQPAVLEFVNALFCEALGPDYEPLRPHRSQVSPTPAVEFLWASDAPAESVEGDSSRPSASGDASYNDAAEAHGLQPVGLEQDATAPTERLRRREADWIARRIRAMLDAGERIVWDEAAEGQPAVRAVRQGDIALLFRALTNIEYYEEALRRYGIDYYLVGGHAFYAQQEVFDLLNLLRALASPCDAVSLAGVLRSPLFGLFDETLLWLAHEDGLAAGLFDAELPEEIDGEQRRRAEFAAATLRDLRAMKDRLPIAQLIHEALRRTGYDALLLTEFLGERKLANLHKLIDQARTFDRAGIFTLSDYVTQLAEFVARQPDEPLAATHPETAKVVKLMSIHQSKGLEFPVVIVPDVDRPRRTMGPAVAFTPQLGPMFKDKGATTGYDLYLSAENEEDLAEMNRLFYVAATRAADYLILSAGVENLDEPQGPWMQLLARQFDLLTGMPRPVGGDSSRRSSASGDASYNVEVKVTTAAPAIQSEPVDLRRRRDLLKIIEKARQMAADGSGKVPRYLEAVPHDAAARRQYSFSRLTGMLHAHAPPLGAEPLDGDAPAEPPLDPRGLGTLVHAVLAEVDFARPGDVEALVRRHAPEHLPEAEGGLDEPIEMVRRFLASPRAAEIVAAGEVYVEIEFLLAWPPDDPQPGGRYLQGFLDCLYCDAAGQWHVIDYKTNRVAEERIGAVAADYEMQMLVYALAVERILKRPPAEVALCFLRPGLEHRFPWDDAARRRAVELVNAALP